MRNTVASELLAAPRSIRKRALRSARWALLLRVAFPFAGSLYQVHHAIQGAHNV